MNATRLFKLTLLFQLSQFTDVCIVSIDLKPLQQVHQKVCMCTMNFDATGSLLALDTVEC